MSAAENRSEDIAREIALVREVAELDDGDEVTFDDEGWDSRAYIVNRGEAVFKFPRTAAAQAAYPGAIATLRLIGGGDGTVRVPAVRWIGSGYSYFGCVGVVGRQLGHVQAQLEESQLERIGTDLGAFLAWLHRLTLPDARVVTVADEIAMFVRNYAAALPAIEQRFTVGELAELERFMADELPETMRGLGSEPRLCHGDLGPYNLVLADDGHIGVIDFGDMGVFDQSKDFIGFEGATMLDAALAAYGDTPTLRAKVDIRARALPILDLPFLISKGDERAVDACVDRLRGALPTHDRRV